MQSLSRQTRPDFEVVIVDNSGHGLVRRNGTAPGARVIENPRNAGFGTAINQGLHASTSPYLATLNDDAVAHPDWLAALVKALEARPDAGMCASQVRLFGEPRLDSAGMLVARDGSSKQRGHGRLPEDFPVPEEVLMPSGSSALYRRSMLEDIGGFDDDFFPLLRRYRSRTARPLGRLEVPVCPAGRGGASLLAFRRPRLAGQGLLRGTQSPLRAGEELSGAMLLAAPLVALTRYLWHAWYIFKGQGSAARFRAEGNAGPRMLWYVVRAHAALLGNLGRLWRQRREIRARARITPADLPASAAQPRHQRPKDGRPVIRARHTGFPADHRAGPQRGGRHRRRGPRNPPVRSGSSRAGDRRLLFGQHHRGGARSRRRGAAHAAPPGSGRLRAGRLQAGLRTRVPIRHPRGWRRAARRARHSPRLRKAQEYAAAKW